MRSDRERRGFTTESSIRRDVVKRTTVLTPAEQERRAKERSRQAALKIAAKRSEVGRREDDQCMPFLALYRLLRLLFCVY